jgi:ParB-like nuclease domain
VSDPGPKPELKWIDISKLYVDQEYQRSAKSNRSVSNIKYMRHNFSWAFCGALVVCYVKAKKQYAIIDGQHRYLVAKSLTSITELPCIVISDLDIKKQAKSFVVMNTKRVAMHNLAKFHAAVAAGEDDAVALKEILEEARITVPDSPKPKGYSLPREIHSIGSLLSMLGRYSKKQMVWALTIIPEAYGEAKGQMRAMLLKGLVEFIKTHPDADRARMVKVLQDIDPADMESDVRAAVKINGGNSTAAMFNAIERLYKNAGRKAVA